MQNNAKFYLKLIVSILILLFFVFLYENHYAFKQTKMVIQTTQGNLNAILISPLVQDTKGIVVIVHGDGPQNATQDGGYFPMMQVFANNGYAVISWHKPGINDSDGNWLNQSMQDRANETLAVINWLKQQKNINSNKIILWGASQAGWVVPKVQNKIPDDIFASILVSPAINWLRQGQYHTAQELKSRQSSEIINKILNQNQKVLALLKQNASYKEYANICLTDCMSADRYNFVKKNYTADAIADLKNISTPVFLILAEKDKHVDIKETEQYYQKYIPNSLLQTFKIKDVEHNMLNTNIHHSDFLTALVLILLPKDFLIDKNFLKTTNEIMITLNNG